jgi:hypothetical protein
MEITKGKHITPVKGLFYGPEGVGKSTLASKLPNPLFIDIEGGTGQIDIARTPRPTSWAHLLQIVADLVRDQQGYKTLVIDTADWAERLTILQVCAQNGYSGLGGNKDYGASYNQLAGLWSALLTQLEADFIDAGRMHVVFLAHSTTRKFELPEEEGQFDRYELSLEKKVSPLLKQWASLMLFINYKTIVTIDTDKNGKIVHAKGAGGTRRVMYAEHTASWDAKNRYGLQAEMDLDYAKVSHCFAPICSAEMGAVQQVGRVTRVSDPTPVSVQAPMPAPAPVSAAQTNGTMTDKHRSLQRMMSDAGVTWDDVNWVLTERNRYPLNTPLENIDPKFIEGWLLPYWGNVMQMIKAKGVK